MKMYSEIDVENIVEEFLARHFNFVYVELNTDSLKMLGEICESYGIEVENIVENNY